MQKFRKKAIVIEAIQFIGNNADQILSFIGDSRTAYKQGDYIIIETLEGTHWATVNDWIIKGIKGEFYPCKPEIFSQTYENV